MSRKTTDAGERAGVYKELDDVPDRYRLYHHARAYEGRDVWDEYLTGISANGLGLSQRCTM